VLAPLSSSCPIPQISNKSIGDSILTQNYHLRHSARVAPRHVRGRARGRLRSLVFLLSASIAVAALTLGPARLVAGVAPAPVLLTRPNTTRGVALDSVVEMAEPFPPVQALNFSLNDDRRTRVKLFATNLTLLPGEDASAVTAEAEDGALLRYPLTVEYVGVVPGFNWMTAVVVRLNDNQAVCVVTFTAPCSRGRA
jgi:hypothetical protein